MTKERAIVETPGLINVSVKLTPEQYGHVQGRAWRTFSTMSEYIRQLVFEDMERNSEPTGPRAA